MDNHVKELILNTRNNDKYESVFLIINKISQTTGNIKSQKK